MPKRGNGKNAFQVAVDNLIGILKKEEPYIDSIDFWNDIENITHGITVKVDLNKLRQEISKMPPKNLTYKRINGIKILLKGYEMSSEFDEFYGEKRKYTQEDKDRLLALIDKEIANNGR